MPVPITFLTSEQHETFANKLIDPHGGNPTSIRASMMHREAMIQAQAERDIDDILDAEFMGTTTKSTKPVASGPFYSDHYHTELSLKHINLNHHHHVDHYIDNSTVNMHSYSSSPSALIPEMPPLPNITLSCDTVDPRSPDRSADQYHIPQSEGDVMENNTFSQNAEKSLDASDSTVSTSATSVSSASSASTKRKNETVPASIRKKHRNTMTKAPTEPYSSYLKEKFEEKINALRKFREKYGHVNVPTSPHLYPEDTSLVLWCKNMRAAYKFWIKGEKNPHRLTNEKVKRLEELGFEWNLKGKRKNDRFEGKFQELLEYKKKHGHMEIPQQSGEDNPLYQWCGRLRRDYKEWIVNKVPLPGPRSGLTEEYVQKLKEIGFRFEIRSKIPFEERIEELREFKRKYGHVRLTDKTNKLKEYESLAKWCSSIRYAYPAWKYNLPNRKIRGLNEERVKVLEDMGFQFRLQKKRKYAQA